MHFEKVYKNLTSVDLKTKFFSDESKFKLIDSNVRSSHICQIKKKLIIWQKMCNYNCEVWRWQCDVLGRI